MANLSAFYETKKLFSSYSQLSQPLTFTQWDQLSHEYKSAALFVQFYNQICMAWDKANAFDFIAGEEGVSIVCQYLEKNVPIIEAAPNKFTPAYIYKVAYNCMYCICHDLKREKDRWENETSAIVGVGEDEINLFDTVADGSGSAESVYDQLKFQAEFWRAIEDAGLEAEKVVQYLLSGDKADLKKVSKRSQNYRSDDPLRDIEVSLDQVDEILEVLRKQLAQFRDMI